MDIVLIDYGAGNLRSVAKGFHAAGCGLRVVDEVGALGRPDAIVIPGVGHFGTTAALGTVWRPAIQTAIDRGAPLLGICVGLQWLFDGSEEAPETPGLGVMRGRCFRLSGGVKVPHVGWNTLAIERPASRLVDGLPSGVSAYFTHSYAAPSGADSVATTTHGVPFAAIVERGRIFGVQCHPEKSGAAGLRMLANFLNIVREDAPCSRNA